MMMIEFFF